LPTIHHDEAGSAPGVFVLEVNGLYVAGDWVGLEGRLADAAMISAKLAAQGGLTIHINDMVNRKGLNDSFKLELKTDLTTNFSDSMHFISSSYCT
jgi:hypothetical protein